MLTRKLMIPVLFSLLGGLTSAAAAPVTVILEGHDQPVTGYLRNISTPRFLLQGEDDYLEFDGDAIVTVDGRDEIPASAYRDRPLVMSSHFEEIQAGGDVTAHYQITFTNRSQRVITSTEWGVAPHETDQYAGTVAHDSWGNRLTLEMVEKAGKQRVVLHFVVPVVPGEASTFALTRLLSGGAERDGDGWSYRFNVDFPEDRYYFRKVALPAGAEVVSTYHGCKELEMDGRVLIVSQRYYPAGTVDPLTIRYRLP